MKTCLGAIFLLLSFSSIAQKGVQDWALVDAYTENISADTPDSLALKLTSPFQTDLQKVRAIYSWITRNISYTTGRFTARRQGTYKPLTDPTDTMSVWKSGDEMAAIRVMYRKATVCEGYARLFKVLCDYAGLQSRIIYGYARSGMGANRFRSNHAWNAVLIDSTWRLLDITWASGYFNYRDEFVQQRNDHYFLTPPQDFILDHYPEDMRWALLPHLPVYRELRHSPFPYKAFDKYTLHLNEHTNGVIEKSVGDTVTIILTSKNSKRDKTVSPGADFDSTILEQTMASVFLSPSAEGNHLKYTYVVQTKEVEWLHLLYNNDLVLRYRLNIKERE